MDNFKKVLLALCIIQVLLNIQACKKNNSRPPIDDEVDLDGNKINDSSLAFPGNYLLSAAIPNPTAADLMKPVVIAVHGFSGSNFEWTEFRDWAKTKNDFHTSLVLLGGHGRDYEDFKASTWQEWQSSIIEEYNKLKLLGYKKITLVASSTGCPLALEMISSGKINTDVLKQMVFIDPIIVPSNKILSVVQVVGPMIGYTKTELDPGENGYWYKYRPQHALKELEKVIRQERKKLQKGITLPEGLTVKVYKSEKDGSADPTSAVLIKKGLRLSDGSGIEVVMLDTDLHVFTRLHGRSSITEEQKNLQLKTFEEIHSSL